MVRKGAALGNERAKEHLRRLGLEPKEILQVCWGVLLNFRENWWTAWDSNPRPPRCERGALPTELAALFAGTTASLRRWWQTSNIPSQHARMMAV